MAIALDVPPDARVDTSVSAENVAPDQTSIVVAVAMVGVTVTLVPVVVAA